jgi:hypothetical protein
MPNRFQVAQYDLAYNFLSAYEGKYCLVGKIGHEKCKGSLQIDHADNNPWNWKPGNIHLVCRKHNLELRKLTTKEHKAKMARYSAKNERERKKIKGDIPGDLVVAMVDYTSGSPEMQVNVRCKQLFTDWVIELLNSHGQWSKKDIINSGAHISGCNTQTSRRYLDALIGSVGPLQESRDEMGEVIISYRKR